MNGGVPFAWRVRHVRAGGAVIAVYEAGRDDVDAPVVVLLHGLGHWADAAWSPLLPFLDDARRYVAIDLPGFGASERPDVRYDAGYFRRTVEEVAHALGLERFALVGHSVGGFVAADVASGQPERVTHLALIAPAGFTRSARHAAIALLSRAFGGALTRRAPSRAFVRGLLQGGVAHAAVDDALVDRAYALARDRGVRRAFVRVYASALDLLAGGDGPRARLARFTGPVLCAWGRYDRYVPPAIDGVLRIYPHATTLILERSGHVAMMDEPQPLARALDAFFAT